MYILKYIWVYIFVYLNFVFDLLCLRHSGNIRNCTILKWSPGVTCPQIFPSSCKEVRSTWNGRNELHLSGFRFPRNDVLLLSGTRRVIFWLQRGYPRGTTATCRSGLEGQIFHSNNKDPIRSIKTRTPLEVEGLLRMIPTAHVRYIKILTCWHT